MPIKRIIPNSLKTRAKELLGIARLEREIHRWNSMREFAAAQLRQIDERLASLESVTGFTKNIDLLRLGDFFYFVYEGDHPHIGNSPDTWRQHTKLSAAEISLLVAEARRSDARRDLHRTDAVARAVWSLAKSGQPVNLLYVGCNYGFHLTKIADFIQKRNLNCRIVALDPGIAGTLAASNFRFNHLHNIEFYHVAASSVDSHAIMQHIVGHSEDNKLVNHADLPLRISRLVETVTLDAFCAQHRVAGPTVLLMDTQGNEPDVMAGAARFLKNNLCVIVSEFTPAALCTRMLAQDYLALLAKYGEIYNLGEVDQQAHRTVDSRPSMPLLLSERVSPENWDAFTARIYHEPAGWTDVLVIPDDQHLGRLVAADFNVAEIHSSNERVPLPNAA